MNRLPFASSLTALLLVSTPILSAQTVSITQKSTGKSLSVKILGYSEGEVRFRANGRVYELAEDKLTPDSLDRVKEALAAAGKLTASLGVLGEKANELAGHSLFGEKSLWQEPAEEVAQRLRLPRESRKEDSSSYRLYPPSDYFFLGAHPYCITLYGNSEHQPESFSLVYANKGDFGSTMGRGEDHFKKVHPDKELPTTLEEAIELDAELIATTLSELLGEPEDQYYGEKEDKRRVKRWDLGDHAFLLSTMDEEYTSLLIVPTEVADAEGKVEFIADSEMKKQQAGNLRQEDNGDVWIDNIPMVDQGPKGYCAPATFERAMRYMRIPADMYLLATAATAPGGGTNTMKLSDDCKRIVRSKARKIRELELDEDLDLKTVRKYIDKGVPILWQMCSLPNYNQIANTRTIQRSEVENFEKWAEEIAEEAEKVAPGLAIPANHHICMIIGYNEATKELAVSDSWGPEYELRWVHVDIAKAVTSQGGFVIDY
ncbi:hypothetical protein [Roseibacillus ishigakijimensis]|uniref:Peptidase C39-like domain-containing protein n=1 Tax=Roseibacillus ishigakijimensis TaxID=454146 RepID=A0A934RN88_9BACT|nr:hypothetical protein [Roseibacillus ishigakijimensis]MBK1833933.1 hypothetical protein [Roseibacillus ishigakijimensis]